MAKNTGVPVQRSAEFASRFDDHIERLFAVTLPKAETAKRRRVES